MELGSLLKIRLLHIITGQLKNQSCLFPFPKTIPPKFESNAGRPVFCGLRWKSKTLAAKKPQ
jgi:hypothetical protein